MFQFFLFLFIYFSLSYCELQQHTILWAEFPCSTVPWATLGGSEVTINACTFFSTSWQLGFKKDQELGLLTHLASPHLCGVAVCETVCQHLFFFLLSRDKDGTGLPRLFETSLHLDQNRALKATYFTNTLFSWAGETPCIHDSNLGLFFRKAGFIS